VWAQRGARRHLCTLLGAPHPPHALAVAPPCSPTQRTHAVLRSPGPSETRHTAPTTGCAPRRVSSTVVPRPYWHLTEPLCRSPPWHRSAPLAVCRRPSPPPTRAGCTARQTPRPEGPRCTGVGGRSGMHRFTCSTHVVREGVGAKDRMHRSSFNRSPTSATPRAEVTRIPAVRRGGRHRHRRPWDFHRACRSTGTLEPAEDTVRDLPRALLLPTCDKPPPSCVQHLSTQELSERPTMGLEDYSDRLPGRLLSALKDDWAC